MAAKSKNKHDVYSWIKDDVIPSCTNVEHRFACIRLLSNFRETYNDYELSRELMLEYYSKLSHLRAV